MLKYLTRYLKGMFYVLRFNWPYGRVFQKELRDKRCYNSETDQQETVQSDRFPIKRPHKLSCTASAIILSLDTGRKSFGCTLLPRREKASSAPKTSCSDVWLVTFPPKTSPQYQPRKGFHAVIWCVPRCGCQSATWRTVGVWPYSK